MHTSYTFCIPISHKTASEVVRAYVEKVYSQFGGSYKVLTNNGTEFKDQLMDEACRMLGVEHIIYSPPYRPQSNGQIEGFHNFLKGLYSKAHICHTRMG